MSGPEQPFVIQKHTTPTGVHWDLMLQMGEILWTWRLFIPPEQIPLGQTAAERIVDHPLRFLSYEGPVRNQTGSVQIAESGIYTIENQTEDELVVYFRGTTLTGRYVLTRQNEIHWLLDLSTPL